MSTSEQIFVKQLKEKYKNHKNLKVEVLNAVICVSYEDTNSSSRGYLSTILEKAASTDPLYFILKSLSPKEIVYKFYDKCSEKSLGLNERETANAAKEIGINKFNEGDFENASKFFNIASIHSPTNSSDKKFAKASRDSADSVMRGMNEVENGDFTNGREKLVEGQNQAPNRIMQNRVGEIIRELDRKEATKKQKAEIQLKNAEKIEKQKMRESEARIAFNQGNLEWNEAWQAENDENNDRSDEANKYFTKANELFVEASNFMQQNEIYRNRAFASYLKMEGNKYFNEGIDLHEEGKKLMCEIKYNNALFKYELARKQFNKGRQLSGDKRFDSSIDLVDELITETNDALMNTKFAQKVFNRENLIRYQAMHAKKNNENNDRSGNQTYKNNASTSSFTITGNKHFNQDFSYQEEIKTLRKETKSPNIEDSTNTELAQDAFNRGYLEWNQAWQAEKDESTDRSDEANQKFTKANELFSKASNIMPKNEIFKICVSVSSLKRAGNKHFNEGISLQEEGQNLMCEAKYKEAILKYKLAREKFNEGRQLSGDERFDSCINLVDELITKTENAMYNTKCATIEIGQRKRFNPSEYENTREIEDEMKSMQINHC